MFQIEQWSKERVHNVTMELLYSFNYMWFLAEEWIKKNCPEDVAREGMLHLTDEFGAYEARRLEKTVPKDIEGIDRLIRFLEHSHWCAFEDIQITKLSDTSMRMSTVNCTSQLAAKKWGMEYYDCGTVALRLRTAFFKRINPAARVTPILTPPDKAADDFPSQTACAWLITIE